MDFSKEKFASFFKMKLHAFDALLKLHYEVKSFLREDTEETWL